MNDADVTEEYVVGAIKRDKPVIVGITGTTSQASYMMLIGELMLKVDPRVQLVFGGVHASFVPEDFIDRFPQAVVVHGEGEEVFNALVDCIFSKGDMGKIDNLSYKGRICKEFLPNGFPDINKLLPSYHLLQLGKYRYPGVLFTSRGCRGNCIFCSARAMSQCYRCRNVESISKEIDLMINQYGIDRFAILDDSFTTQKKHVVDVCNEFRSYGIEWFCESRIDTVDKDILENMSSAGCIGIQYGIETAEQSIIFRTNKNIRLDSVEGNIIQTFKAGIESIACSFIVGLPGETEASLQKTYALMKRLHRMGCEIGVALCTPFPGTDLFNNVDKYGTLTSRIWTQYNLHDVVFLAKDLSEETIRDYYYSITKEFGSH